MLTKYTPESGLALLKTVKNDKIDYLDLITPRGYFLFEVYYDSRAVMHITDKGILFCVDFCDYFEELCNIFQLGPFEYMLTEKYSNANWHKAYSCYRSSGLLYYKGKSYINKTPDDYHSCMIISAKRLTALCRNIHKYRKRIICIDFRGRNINAQPWMKKRLMLLLTMSGLDKVIFMNYRRLTNYELPYELISDMKSLVEYVIEYFSLTRTSNVKSAKKIINSSY
jgi:hypothetical protein